MLFVTSNSVPTQLGFFLRHSLRLPPPPVANGLHHLHVTVHIQNPLTGLSGNPIQSMFRERDPLLHIVTDVAQITGRLQKWKQRKHRVDHGLSCKRIRCPGREHVFGHSLGQKLASGLRHRNDGHHLHVLHSHVPLLDLLQHPRINLFPVCSPLFGLRHGPTKDRNPRRHVVQCLDLDLIWAIRKTLQNRIQIRNREGGRRRKREGVQRRKRACDETEPRVVVVIVNLALNNQRREHHLYSRSKFAC
jgi:hypothetical protein